MSSAKDAERRILAFERTCYRKLLRIGWMQKVTNEELYRRLELKKHLQKVIRRKLHLFGHDARKPKTLISGKMDGKNRRGRPHKEWIDDVKAWCGIL